MTNYDKRLILGVLIVLLCFGYIYLTAFIVISRSSDIVLGFILGSGTAIINFYFGSSDKKGKNIDGEEK